MTSTPNPGGLPSMDDGYGGKFCYYGWECHYVMCKTVNPITDGGEAWKNKTPEYCRNPKCQAKRCAKCFDVTDQLWRLQHCNGSAVESWINDIDNLEYALTGEKLGADLEELEEESEEFLGEIDKADIVENLKVEHLENGKWACRFKNLLGCEKTFQSSSNASRHSKSHIRRPRISCTIEGCKSTFSMPDNLENHINYGQHKFK